LRQNITEYRSSPVRFFFFIKLFELLYLPETSEMENKASTSGFSQQNTPASRHAHQPRAKGADNKFPGYLNSQA